MYSQGYRPQNPAGAQPAQPSAPARGVWYAPPPRPDAPAAPAARGKGGKSGAGGGKRGAPKRKGGAKGLILKALIALVLLAAAAGGIYVWKAQSDVRPYMGIFLDNVSVDGVELGGLTWAEGSAKVWEQANARQNGWYVRLKNAAGEYKDITAQTLGIAFDPSQALEQAWAVGHATDPSGRVDVFEARRAIEEAKTTPRAFYSAEKSADTAPIDDILATLERAAYQAPSDARLLSFNPDDTENPFAFQSEVYGRTLDTTAVRERILRMVQTLESGEVLVEPTLVAPAVTVADLQNDVALRFRAVTPIASNSTENRTDNIRVAFAKINGMVLEDGSRFSFNSVVGRRTAKNGFGEAIEYAYGQEVLGIGGGVCQASTTIYLAAIQSGMTIVKRSAHSNPVSYTDLGKDATVSDTKGREVDFSFRNDSGAPVYIAAHVIASGKSKKSLLCEVRIYGRTLGAARYELQSETVETLPKPEEPTLVPDENALYVTFEDETKRISKGREGYVVDTYLVTFADGVMTERAKVSTDTYPARADRYWVGVTPRIVY